MKNINSYSEELKIKTKGILYDMPFDSFVLGHCHLKSVNNGFAKIKMEDALACDYKIRDIKTDVILCEFETLDELVDAGWVVD